jgi:hypothetical protein
VVGSQQYSHSLLYSRLFDWRPFERQRQYFHHVITPEKAGDHGHARSGETFD